MKYLRVPGSKLSAHPIGAAPLLMLIALSGCSGTLPTNASRADNTASAVAMTSGAPCAGTVMAPFGLSEVSDPDLLKSALGMAGKGGLCAGKVYRVDQPLTVYRVWDSGNPNAQFGRWWTFNPPTGPLDTFRSAYEICPEWSRLDKIKQCRLKAGQKIVLGTGQSAQCASHLSYAQSADLQVFIPNDTRDPNNMVLDVDHCLPDANWTANR
ncbi:hypothetical protein [Dyella sp. M7H15-1]|uniref:hypothetical protein n=1 Tax=Dyella sp. M7H15-1 TaxID=2501295 RepID=UPI00197AB923|nr:hypothetical protein [Dyella sp. M7H15-1]